MLLNEEKCDEIIKNNMTVIQSENQIIAMQEDLS